jgi:16S rRNA (uracil1498-N3)-methyltransferase
VALHFVVDDASGDVIELTGSEAHHAAAVRRVRVGEDVTVTDGRGTWLTGSVSSVEPKRVAIAVASRSVVEAPARRILLAQALAKGDRDELAVQAATELDIDGIIPWQATRSVSRWSGPKAAKGQARWQTIVREAAKQAHRAWIPDVAPVASTADLVSMGTAARIVVLDPWTDHRVAELDWSGEQDVILVVGPEGGIAPEELAALTDAGAVRARLGRSVLRTSTAGPVSLWLQTA